MLSIHTILHPTDFSEQAGYAFQMACSLARDFDARLILLHVAPVIVYGEGVPIPQSPKIMEEFNQHLQRLHPDDPGIRLERMVTEGDPVTEILRVARENKCDLIAMGTHGRSAIGRFLMGSVAQTVVRKANCPVLTVKNPFYPGRTPTTQEENVAVAM